MKYIVIFFLVIFSNRAFSQNDRRFSISADYCGPRQIELHTHRLSKEGQPIVKGETVSLKVKYKLNRIDLGVALQRYSYTMEYTYNNLRDIKRIDGKINFIAIPLSVNYNLSDGNKNNNLDVGLNVSFVQLPTLIEYRVEYNTKDSFYNGNGNNAMPLVWVIGLNSSYYIKLNDHFHFYVTGGVHHIMQRYLSLGDYKYWNPGIAFSLTDSYLSMGTGIKFTF